MDESMDMDMDMERTPSPGPPARSMDIHLGQEIVTIDLGDALDPNPDAVLEVLVEGQCKVWYWTKLAGEYWRKGLFDSAELLAKSGVNCKVFILL
jgi:RNA polymerase-associated protein CTR9